MIALSVILVLITLVLSICYWAQTWSRTANLLNKFPEPWPVTPVFGHVWKFSLNRGILFKQFRDLNKKLTETCRLWAGPYPGLNVVTADDAELSAFVFIRTEVEKILYETSKEIKVINLLMCLHNSATPRSANFTCIILSNVKHINKGQIYEGFHKWLKAGLLTSTGEKWHKRRKMLTPAFHYNILQMFIEIFGEQCDILNKTLQEECKKSKTNIIPVITMTTLSTICETSMGIKLDSNNKNLSAYHEALYQFADLMVGRVLKPWLYNDIIYSLFPLAWRERKLVKYLHKFTRDIIQSREKTFQIEDVADLESEDNKSTKRLAMLDLLLYAKQHLGQIDDEGIREEVDTFVFEGHDTTSIGISFALLLFANHKDVQEKIIIELDEIFGDSKRHPTYDDLQNMKYLERCLKESLRLYPSVPLILRRITEDTPLTHHVAPSGTEFFIHIYDIHRDPKYYPDPEKFDPDRFLPENVKGRHPYAYIPFSAGPRNCIGQKFAMLELKSIVSSILRNFTLEPIDSPQDLDWTFDIVLRVNGPIHMKFQARRDKISH